MKKIQLPQTIKIGNMTYKIERDIHEGYKGIHMYEPGDLKIIIDPRLEGDELINVLYHEIIHAILYELGADEECENEMLVQGLANEIQKLFTLEDLTTEEEESKCGLFISSTTGMICDTCGEHYNKHIILY